MPEWLKFNEDMRTFEGTPIEKGDYEVIVTAMDLVGEYVDYKFTITVGLSWF